MSATTDTPTAEDRTEQFDYYLLLSGTDLPRSVSRDLPASVSQQAPIGSGINWKVDRGRSKFTIIRVDTEAMRVDAARGRDAVHPDPAGEWEFSSTSEIVFNRSDSFSDDIRKPSSTFVDGATVESTLESGGRAGGTYKQHRLLKDPAVVKESVMREM